MAAGFLFSKQLREWQCNPEKLKRNNLGLQDKLLSEIGGQVLGNTVCYFVERLLTKAKCINSSGKVRWKEQGALKS